MNILGNIIWILFGGLLVSIEYIFGGIVLCLTIVGIPFGIQAFKLGVLALFAGALCEQNALVGGGMLLIGSDILLFPLVTPQTIALLGMRAARRAGRALGAVTMAAGVWIGWF